MIVFRFDKAIVTKNMTTERGTTVVDLTDLTGGGQISLSSRAEDLGALAEGSVCAIDAEVTVVYYEGKPSFRVLSLRAVRTLLSAQQIAALGSGNGSPVTAGVPAAVGAK